ncbi:MAG TPA: tRNA nucleotidyltransferase, partial [Bacteroidetes bacterium]|nr:tRNA nucleotidyltransferase [Bacteroidota bacterium]
MQNLTDSLNIQEPLLKTIGGIADRSSTLAFVVGGYVRDFLLGKQVKDIDVVVVGQGV